MQLPLPLCTQFFWHAVIVSISPDRESEEHDTISYLLLLSWLFKEREFPLDDARKESVSAKVLCTGTTVNINRLPHKYPGRANAHSGTKTLWKWGSAALSPSPLLPRVLTNSWKGMTIHLSSKGDFLWWGIFLHFYFQVITLPFNSFSERRPVLCLCWKSSLCHLFVIPWAEVRK